LNLLLYHGFKRNFGVFWTYGVKQVLGILRAIYFFVSEFREKDEESGQRMARIMRILGELF